MADWSDLPDERLLAEELQQVLREAIDALPPDYRAVVVLRDVEGLSNQEAAEVLGSTLFAIKSRLHRAHLVLRERLAGYLESGRRGGPSGAPPPKIPSANFPRRRGEHPGKDTPRAAGAARLCAQERRRAHPGGEAPAARVRAGDLCRLAILP